MHITQINFDGVDLRNADYRFTLQGLWDIEKDIVTNELLLDGVNYGRSKNKAKTLVLNGIVKSKDIKKFFALNALFARNGLKKLVVTIRELGRLYTYVEVSNRAKGSTSRAISCQLTMPEPYWYALDADTIQLGSIYSTGVIFGSDVGVIFDDDTGVVFGTATGESGMVVNQGNVKAYPVITIIGDCSGISVTNLTTNETISVDVVLHDTDKLVIDCRPETCGVYLNGVANIGLKTTVGWIHCEPGENQFTFARHSLQDKKHCSVSLQSRWI